MERATFAAGCFWGVEEVFRTLEGVIETTVGYMGGITDNPDYKMVCSGETGHAEVVDIRFDPEVVSFSQLLEKFWDKHNPTTLNRQGADFGTQYRSAIFFYNEEQRQQAEDSKEVFDKSGSYKDPVVTEIVPAGPFWRAEDYHQKYILKHQPGFSCS